MIGLMSLLSEGAVPGSVPALKGLIPASGEINVMAPFDFAQPLFGNVATLAVQGRDAPAPRSGAVQIDVVLTRNYTLLIAVFGKVLLK